METNEGNGLARAAEAGLDEIRFHVPPGLWRHAARSGFVPAVRLARELGSGTAPLSFSAHTGAGRKDVLVAIARALAA